MRTKIKSIDRIVKLDLHTLMDRMQRVLIIDAACKARLVCDYYQQVVLRFEEGNCLFDVRRNVKVFRPRQITDVFVQRSVAIQEDSFLKLGHLVSESFAISKTLSTEIRVMHR